MYSPRDQTNIISLVFKLTFGLIGLSIKAAIFLVTKPFFWIIGIALMGMMMIGLVTNTVIETTYLKEDTLGEDWEPLDIKDPTCWNGCEEVAEEIQEIIGGEIETLLTDPDVVPGLDLLGDYRETEVGWFTHDVVVKGDRVFDGFGPTEGVPVEDYKELWEDEEIIDWPF